ncbi:hypothetical protein AAG906_040569 [Vitis piasezkii]
MKLSPNTSNSSSSLIPTSVISFQNAETDANGGIEAIRRNSCSISRGRRQDETLHFGGRLRGLGISGLGSGLQNCFIASGTTLMQNMYYLNGLKVTPSVAYVIITNFMYYLNAPQATPSVTYVIIRNFRYYLNALKVTPTVPYVIIRNFRYYLNAHKIEHEFRRMASIPPLASVSAFWNEITDVGMREDEELERETMEPRRMLRVCFHLRDGWGFDFGGEMRFQRIDFPRI